MKKMLMLGNLGLLLTLNCTAAPAPKKKIVRPPQKTTLHHTAAKPTATTIHKAPIPAKFTIAKKAYQQKEAQRRVAKKASMSKKAPKPRFEKRKDVLGFVRSMPNKIMTYNKNAFLVNQYDQRMPVALEKQAPTSGSQSKNFYLGSFYDDSLGIVQHVYLTSK